MAGTLLSVAITVCGATVAAALVTAGAAAAFGQQLAGAADAAALAAADAASGAVVGVPCDRAAEVAAATGAEITACSLEGLIATVEVSSSFLRLPASAAARAGPPPS